MKYSKEIVDEICQMVGNGVFNKDAAICAGISESTFYNWKNGKGGITKEQQLEFLESLKRAEASRKKNFINAIADAATKQWQAAAWYLERVYREEFARKEIQEIKEKQELSEEQVKQMEKIFNSNEKSNGANK